MTSGETDGLRAWEGGGSPFQQICHLLPESCQQFSLSFDTGNGGYGASHALTLSRVQRVSQRDGVSWRKTAWGGMRFFGLA